MRHCMMALALAGVTAFQLQAGTVTGPVEYATNDWFELVLPDSPAGSYSWTQARDTAAGMTYQGLPGHLATVHSASANTFLKDNFSSYLLDDGNTSTYAWIGLFAETSSSYFQWVTAEPVDYLNWAPNEPNYFRAPNWQYVYYWTRNFGNGPTWTWDNTFDAPANNSYGFLVEFGAQPPVPEPSAFVMMAMGMGVVVIYFMRK